MAFGKTLRVGRTDPEITPVDLCHGLPPFILFADRRVPMTRKAAREHGQLAW